MKSEALIDLLLDTAQANPQSRIPRRAASVRSVSRDSTTNTKSRVGSMIIHDLSEDEGDGATARDAVMEDEGDGAQSGDGPQSQPANSLLQGPATRTRKAKDTQFKLGLGRPKALGGVGPRKLSKDAPADFRGRKRVKASVSVQPTQAAIQEVDEEGRSRYLDIVRTRFAD